MFEPKKKHWLSLIFPIGSWKSCIKELQPGEEVKPHLLTEKKEEDESENEKKAEKPEKSRNSEYPPKPGAIMSRSNCHAHWDNDPKSLLIL